jgi:hypothetical protein
MNPSAAPLTSNYEQDTVQPGLVLSHFVASHPVRSCLTRPHEKL